MGDGEDEERKAAGGAMSGAARHVCIHGHFYQPPRENPWLEAVEVQDSAYPFHDWNDRITAECYRPNGASRILDEEGWIARIQNNYEHISFNFGPTLLDWLGAKAPDVHRTIVEADRRGAERHGGHGPAMAQPYNHMIMPLANRRDKVTQVRWGIADFVHHFGRQPEGMWLPETGVDTETLEILAEHGIRFTVLEPHQATRFRRIGEEDWTDAKHLDPSRPYKVVLPSGADFHVFFYDGPVSRAVAFERLLENGGRFAQRILGLLPPQRRERQPDEPPPIVSIATDGETYGHHHRHGDMALAYAIRTIIAEPNVELLHYAAYLARHPPVYEVEIKDDTSWSCVHGIERWRSDCGCTTGANPEWDQAWRAPLRKALDNLRDRLLDDYATAAARHLADPWAARDAYQKVVLDRSPRNVAAFLQDHARHPLGPEDRVHVLRLLEMQRHALLMFTSCGWFFEELTRIETTQVLQYAARAIQLAEETLDRPYTSRFLSDLREARPNIPGYRDGADVYNRMVRPAMVDLDRVAAHYALGSLFDDQTQRDELWSYRLERSHMQTRRAGRAKLAIGRVRVVSLVTEETESYSYASLHLGDQSLHGGVRPLRDTEQESAMVADVLDAFERLDLTRAIRVIDRHFGERTFSLRSLFLDEQRRILDHILSDTLGSVEATYERLYEQHLPLMRFLGDIGPRLPSALATTATFVLNNHMRRAIGGLPETGGDIERLLRDAERDSVPLDEDVIRRALRRRIHVLTERLEASPADLDRLRGIVGAIELGRRLPFALDLRFAEDRFYTLIPLYAPMEEKARSGSSHADEWCNLFRRLSAALKVRIAT